MKLKFFFTLIMVIGCLVFIFGCLQYFLNQPKQFDPLESEQTILARNDSDDYSNSQIKNFQQAQNREDFQTYILIGGLLTIVGLCLKMSVKQDSAIFKNENSSPSDKEKD